MKGKKGKEGQGGGSAKSKAEDAFGRFYNQTFPKEDGVVRFFGQKEIFSVHGEAAKFVAQEYFRTLAAVTFSGSQRLPTVEMKQEKYEEVVRDLILVKLKKVEVWGKTGTNWAKEKKASPGNVRDFEELLYRNKELEDTAVSVAICFGVEGQHKMVGAAFADAILRKIGYCQFVDTVHLANLESLLLQIGARECILAPGGVRDEIEMKKLDGLLERCGIMKTEVKKAHFKAQDIEQDLSRLVREDMANNLHQALEHSCAMSSLAAIIKHMELLSDEDNFRSYQLKTLDLSKYMRIDQPASRALNLFPSPTDTDKSFSLYGLLNKCRTAMGSRRLLQWIKQPLLNIDDIEVRQNIVEIFVEDAELRQSMQEHFRRITDIDRLIKKFQRTRITASLKDCVVLYDIYRRLPSMHATLSAYSTKNAGLLHEQYTDELARVIDEFSDFQRLIEGCIDLDAAQNNEYQINARFDPEFTQWCEEKEQVKQKIDTIFRAVQRELGADKRDKDSVELENSKVHEWHIVVPKKASTTKLIKSKRDWSVLEDTTKAMRITTPLLTKQSRRWTELEECIQAKQKELVLEIIKCVASYVPLVEDLSILLADLDVFVSLAHVAVNAPAGYVRPRLTPSGTGDVILKQARHPCLELQDGVGFIANDVIMKRDDSSFQIITGPNMGGKSTYIRSAGVIVLMAQLGSFVPCSTAVVSVVDCIMCRLGASDSQLRGVSTFMAEMQETSSILKAATQRSLIIIDELGRGTSTYDGFGLAWAISEHIINKIGCFCFFATHFHELTALEQHIPKVKNLHVTAQTADNKLVLLYNIKQGPSDKSFGIHIAELAGFPPSVIEVAQQKVETLEKTAQTKGVTSGVGQKRERPTSKPGAGAASAVKRPRTEGPEEEGTRLVRQFLDDFKKLPLDSLSPAEAMQRMKGMRERLMSHNNPFVLTLLSAQQSA